MLTFSPLQVWQLESAMSLVASCKLAIEGPKAFKLHRSLLSVFSYNLATGADTNRTLRDAHSLLATLGVSEATVEVECEGADSENKRLQEVCLISMPGVSIML